MLPASNKLDFPDLLRRFQNHLKGVQRAENTIISYGSDLTIFNNYLLAYNIDLAETTHITFEHFRHFLKTKKKDSHNTIRRMTIAIRRFYKFLHREAIITENHLAYLSVPKRKEELPRILNQDEFSLFLNTVSGPTLKQLRDRALVLLTGHCGLRVGEVCKLKWDHLTIQKSGSYLYIPSSKTRVIPLSNPIVESLKRYKNKLPKETDYPNVFVSFRGNRESEIINKISRHGIKHLIYYVSQNLGLSAITPQTFRHYAAVKWIEEGLDDQIIANYLGLNSNAGLEKYYDYLEVSS